MATRKSAKEQLGAAKSVANLKIQKHRDNADVLQAKFVPFIMESFGGVILECKLFLSSLLYYAHDNVSPSACARLTSLLYSSMAVAVQRGNGLMLRKCLSMPCLPSVSVLA